MRRSIPCGRSRRRSRHSRRGDRQAVVRAGDERRRTGGDDRRDADRSAHLGRNLGVKHSLENAPREAPWFYGIYTVSLAASGLFVASGVNLISLSVGVQVMNALLLPLVLGFLYLLARRLASAPSAERELRSDRHPHDRVDRGIRRLCRLSGRRGIGKHANVPGRPSTPSASGSGRSSDHRDQ